ncbi:MAG: hypothetical protein HYY43_01495 [Deltaproteobacteria bacterium]|nr:hypothetical protein [Deltaproteobacteria bacterium]
MNNDWPSGDTITASGTKKCYNETCHSVYPHVQYINAAVQTLIWKDSGAHYIYLMDNVHFGWSNLSKQAGIDEVNSKCGGVTPGYCHNGTRQKKEKKVAWYKACELCHSPK